MNSEIDVNEVLEQLDEVGRAKFDAALSRVRVVKLQAQLEAALARIDELERQKGTPDVGEH